MGLDIDQKSRERFNEIIRQSKSIFWNGPMGVFEMSNFSNGTKAIAQAVADATQNNGAYSLIGGGDSVAAIHQLNLADKVSYVSTGGGAMLTMMEGGDMPAVWLWKLIRDWVLLIDRLLFKFSKSYLIHLSIDQSSTNSNLSIVQAKYSGERSQAAHFLLSCSAQTTVVPEPPERVNDQISFI